MILSTLTEWGAFLTGLATFMTAVGGGLVFLINRWRKQDKKEILDHFDTKVWAIVEKRMLEAAERAGPDFTHVIRIMFFNGLNCSVPLTREWVEVDPCGAQIQLLETSEDETKYQLRCPTPYQINTHCHIEEESVTVQYGSMTDLSTGKTYRAGQVWIIPPKTPHTVFFSAGSLLIITVRPPLPTMNTHPLELRHLEQITSGNGRVDGSPFT